MSYKYIIYSFILNRKPSSMLKLWNLFVIFCCCWRELTWPKKKKKKHDILSCKTFFLSLWDLRNRIHTSVTVNSWAKPQISISQLPFSWTKLSYLCDWFVSPGHCSCVTVLFVCRYLFLYIFIIVNHLLPPAVCKSKLLNDTFIFGVLIFNQVIKFLKLFFYCFKFRIFWTKN